MTDSNAPGETARADIAIVGGGIAGIWLLHLLSQRGYTVVLFEQDALGCAQTLASQGMIHGGLKYALGGRLTGASEAIATMPSRWRACLAGTGEIDLTGLELLAERYYMFAANTTMGKLTTFLASKALRGRINRLPASEWPAGFNGFDGIVYALNDFVLNTQRLLQTLSEPWQSRMVRQRIDADSVTQDASGYRISTPDKIIHVDTLISCAGDGSAQLADEAGCTDLETQRRPLKQVIVRPRHTTLLQAHCVTGITGDEPRITITSHRDTGDEQRVVWYLGGLLANTGVDRSDAEQIEFAQSELNTCVPWLDWSGADWSVLYVDRAEPRHLGGLKPDEASVRRQGRFIQCFPTKLTLAPDLGDKVLAELDAPAGYTQPELATPGVPLGTPPW